MSQLGLARPIAAAVLLLSGAAVATAVFGQFGPETLERTNLRLAEQVTLAERERPYLMLDLSAPRLRLMMGGALLREFAVSGAEVGTPTVLFVRRSPPSPFAGRPRTLAGVHPPRRSRPDEVVAPVPGSVVEPPLVPPDPVEAEPAPERFFLRFDDGLSIEVRQERAATGGWRARYTRLRWKLVDMLDASRPGPASRLRLVMPESEAGSLYRSIPQATPLIVS
ncbi:MAG TPA: hypothetical protein VD788_12115 [Candidatus Polarisedimenticolaceae bacterium]|nr:hypothetical protein [Candidatus Polarisedimenticolaceae bacterium]